MNEPVPMSAFGAFTNECSYLFCRDKDGLNLWLTIVNECSKETTYTGSIFTEIPFNASISPLYVAFICASVAYLCFTMTYNLTTKILYNEL